MEKRNIGKLIAGVVIIAFVFIAALMFGLPRYNVWQQEMAGKAEMAKAEQNRRILVEEAKAKLEAEKLNAQAEIERAKGMAEIAKKTGLSREQLYRSFSERGNPTLKTTLAVMRALGIDITTKPHVTSEERM